MRNCFKIHIFLSGLVLFGAVFFGCAKKETAATSTRESKDVPPQFSGMSLKYNSIEEMAKNDRLVIGMHTGFVMVDKLTREMLPNAKIEYYKTTADLSFMTATGKIDGFINDEPVIRYAALEVPDMAYIHCGMEPMNIVACFPRNEKGASLRDDFNVYVKKWREDGTLKQIDDLWLGDDESKKVVDLTHFEGKKGKIRVGTEANCPPFEYIKDGKVVGYEIDLIARFCREAGYTLEIQDVPFDSLIMGLESGMYDLAVGCLSETPAHKESTNVSEPIYFSELVMAVQILNHGKAGSSSAVKISSVKDLNDPSVTIGYSVATPAEVYVPKVLPKANCKVFNDITIGALSLQQGKIDAFADANVSLEYAIANGLSEMKILPEAIGEPIEIGIGISKETLIPNLKDKVNAFLAEIKENGTLEDIHNRWIKKADDTMPDIPKASNPSFTLRVGTTGLTEPFSYFKGAELTGSDIELALRFAYWLNADLEITTYTWGGMIAAALSNQIDCIFSNLFITPEKAEKIDFSDTVRQLYTKVMVRDTKNAVTGGLASLSSSFEKTFIRESRWKLIAEGICTTILISIFSGLLGTVLGFGICGLRMSGNKFLNGSALVYIRIMQGTPMVVFLMILFYIVFAKSGISGAWVAVIGFGMNFGAYVSEMIRTGILAVDKGQTEAALALGYTKPHLFVKIVLPQAARHFLPVFQGEFISLVKMTSIVGYIAIMDLTKAGDIIRSRTYEAFFPLVTSAIIYFLIAWILTRSLVALQNRIDPKKRRLSKTGKEEAEI